MSGSDRRLRYPVFVPSGCTCTWRQRWLFGRCEACSDVCFLKALLRTAEHFGQDPRLVLYKMVVERQQYRDWGISMRRPSHRQFIEAMDRLVEQLNEEWANV